MCRLAKNVVSTIEVVKVNFEKNEAICFLQKSFLKNAQQSTQ